MRRSLTKKASKLSFGLKGKEKDAGQDQQPDSSTVKSAATSMSKSTSSSLYNVSSNTHTIKGEAEATNGADAAQSPVPADNNAPQTPSKKHLPPIPRDFAAQPQRTMSPAPPSAFPSSSFPTGEVDQYVFDAMSSSRLSVRFEINIVKVRLALIYIYR